MLLQGMRLCAFRFIMVHRFGLVLILGNPAHMEIAQTLQKQLLGGSEIARLTPFGAVR